MNGGSAIPFLAASASKYHLVMPWFAPLAIALGIAGTKLGLEQRHLAGKGRRNHDWWLLPLIASMPMMLWVLAQFVRQY